MVWNESASQRSYTSHKDGGDRNRQNGGGSSSSQKPPRFQNQQAQRMHGAANSVGYHNQNESFQTWTNDTYHNSPQAWMGDNYHSNRNYGNYNARTDGHQGYNGEDYGASAGDHYQGRSNDGSRPARNQNRDSDRGSRNPKDGRTHQSDYYSNRDQGDRGGGGGHEKWKQMDGDDGRSHTGRGRPQSSGNLSNYDGSNNYRGGNKFDSSRGGSQDYGAKYVQSHRPGGHGSGREGNGPPPHQMYARDSKDGSVPNSSYPTDAKFNYSGYHQFTDGVAPSNQYIPDSKQWRWKEGDKCMAKYWEDNRVSFELNCS